MSKDEKFEKSLKIVLETLSKNIEKERQESEPYKDLFSKSVNCESLLREVEFKMTGIILDACQVLEDKFGFTKVPDSVYGTLEMFPFIVSYLTRKIEAEEGSACSVDKVYYILSNEILSRKDNGAE